MQRKDKFDRRSVFVTSLSTLILAFLPALSFPDKFFFVVPGVVEILVMGVLWIWIGYKVADVKKKKLTASESLRQSIDDDIETLKIQIDHAASPKILKQLEKSLADLYKEKLEESAAHRDVLREDIKRYADDDSVLRTEIASIQKQLAEKASEEVKKVGDSVGDPQER